MNEKTLDPEFYEILADSLDAVLAGDASIESCLARYPQYADLLEPDLRAAVLAAHAESPVMPQASVDKLERRLRARLNHAHNGHAAADAPTSTQTRTHTTLLRPRFRVVLGRLAAVIVAVLVIGAIGSGSVVAASADSLPGDTLYPVKRGWEEVVLVVSSLLGNLGDTWLQLAETRLDEAEILAARGELTGDVLADLQDATENAIEHAAGQGLAAYLERAEAALQQPAFSDSGHRAQVGDIAGTIAPVLSALREAGFGSAPVPVVLPTETPTRTPSATPTLTPTFTATPTATATPSATRTPRIADTPTRTPSPTPTAPVTNTPGPSATPTITLPPIEVEPGPGQSGPGRPTSTPPFLGGDGPPTPTWYPWTVATEDARRATRTAEAIQTENGG